MLKHLEQQIYHQSASSMTDKERADFLENVLDPDGIKDPTKA
jgi:hypothetical protein